MKSEDWQSLYEKWKNDCLPNDYEKRGCRKNVFQTDSGIAQKEIYTHSDLQETGFQPERDLGLPGEFPYTRGIYPAMYRATFWIMGQYAGFGGPKNTNERFKYLLARGQSGLAIALDLPTQLGYDSDHELASGEVGKAGVAIDSLLDMEEMFDGISLASVRQIFTTANAISPIMLAFFLVLGEKQGLTPDQYRVVIQNDILKEFVARGTYIFPPQPSLKLTTDVVEYCTKHAPSFRPLVVCGSHMRQAGANAIMEVAFTLSNARAYVEKALARGLLFDDFAPKMEFQMSVPMYLFEEVAKYRAFRRMWARLAAEQYGAKDPRSMQAFFRVYTTGYTMTANQPINNVVRVTIEALAAILGGVQSLSCSAMDEVLGIPTEEAAHVALMTQHILANESGVADVVDPLGGSYYVEFLTNKIEEEAKELMKKIDALGGAQQAIENGYYQRLIGENAFNYQREIEWGERIIVGLNKFVREGERAKIETFRVDPEAERNKIEGINNLRKNRDSAQVRTALKELEECARAGENTVPALIECVRAYATIGEMADVLRRVFGTFKEPRTWL